jgi:hypothetical protein
VQILLAFCVFAVYLGIRSAPEHRRLQLMPMLVASVVLGASYYLLRFV